MDTPRRDRCRRCRWEGSANQRWKDRWDSVRLRSGVAAIVLHAAVFAFWPERKVEEPFGAPGTASRVIALASHGIAPDVGVGAAAEQSESLAHDEPSSASTSAGADDLLDALRVPVPTLARRTLSLAAGDRYRLEPVARIKVAPTSVALTEYGPPQSSFTWPEIRNPRAMVGFLRSQYNAIHSRLLPERFVSVAIWISERGKVEWCEVRESSGDATVDQIALALVNEVMEFIPASKQGEPIPVAVVLSIPFQVPW